jgi:hypothetical protein
MTLGLRSTERANAQSDFKALSPCGERVFFVGRQELNHDGHEEHDGLPLEISMPRQTGRRVLRVRRGSYYSDYS